jgi:hypothetical protein
MPSIHVLHSNTTLRGAARQQQAVAHCRHNPSQKLIRSSVDQWTNTGFGDMVEIAAQNCL